MARIFITGSSDGIGQAAAKLLIQQGHQVTLHARNAQRAQQTREAVPQADGVLVADISSIAGAKDLARQANAAGPWACVVHNAGLGPSQGEQRTADGLAATFAVNTLAPYILTSLMAQPARLLYLSSSIHLSGDESLADVAWTQRTAWHAYQAYADSKLHDVMLANAVARRWPGTRAASLDPGWVRTKMGGGGAPGTTEAPAQAIAAFAAGEEAFAAGENGVYFSPSGAKKPHKGALDTQKQDELLRICEQLSGVAFPD